MPRLGPFSLVLLILLVAVAWPAAPLAPAGPVLVAVPGPLPAATLRLLAKQTAYHGDYGAFALTEAEAGGLSALQRAGIPHTVLGAWPAGEDLLVRRSGASAEGRVLHAAGGVELVALAAGAHGACPAERLVPRTAWAAPRGFHAPGGSKLLAADPRITPLVAQVNGSDIQATVTHLASYFTRRADGATVLQAKDWLVAQASAVPGVQVTTSTFSGSYGPNIVATITGQVHPERVVVLGAHYDSINGSGSSLAAPGADDNASGSAGLLEALSILAQGDFENTIRCTWYCAEEFGLIGSDADAAALAAAGTDVVAMLNMDMIAYRAAGDAADLDFATNDTDATLTQFCRDAAAAYVPSLPTVTGVLTAGTSDHAAYSSHGFPAAFFFEDLPQSSPFIHGSGDTVGASANDWNLARDITKAFVASAATLAAPVDMALAHVPLADTADSGGPYALAVQATALAGAPVAAVEAHARVNGGAEQVLPLMPGLQPGQWVGSLPGVQPSGQVSYWLLATNDDGFTQWLPDALAPGGGSYGFFVGLAQNAFADGFEGPGDNGWTHVQLAQQDDWQRGDPAGAGGDPSAPAQGAAAWGNDLGNSGFNGQYQPNVHNRLESPAISTLGLSGVRLRFQRWLTVEDGLYDQATVLVNGVPVWQNPTTPGGSAHTLDGAWTLQDLDVSAQADNQAAVRVRFELESDGGLEFGGWNVDDLRLLTVSPGSVPPLVASALHVSAAQGGSVALQLDAGPAHAGRPYVVLVSASGSAPTPVGSTLLPLHFDVVTDLALSLLNTPVFANFLGVLSPQGEATATFASPSAPVPGLPGITLTFAYLTLGPIDFASNAVAVQYQP
jgi:Peptidase family M28